MSAVNGLVSLEEIKKCPGWPEQHFIESKRVAVLECIEDIPCNPCETACPQGAITVGEPIINLPVIHAAKCTGCNLCIAACPGLAIVVVEKNYNENFAALSIPYELRPIPEQDQTVKTYDRKGYHIGEAAVIKVTQLKKYDKTCVVTVALPKDQIDIVRSVKL